VLVTHAPEQHAEALVHPAPIAPQLPESGGVAQQLLSAWPQLSSQLFVLEQPVTVQHVLPVVQTCPLKHLHGCDTPHESVTETLH
jgi:hypothetical protein